jgi:hypothetical protein
MDGWLFLQSLAGALVILVGSVVVFRLWPTDRDDPSRWED